MAAKVKEFFQLVKGKIVFYLIAWLFICSFLYAILYIWESNRRQKVIKVGVSISKDISSQSGLPLLEQNNKLLSQIIAEITEKPEVVFASIIDHKNKLIAYTDQEQFLTLNKQRSGVLDDVHYWRISNPDHQRVMNFSSEITFSGTRVGEVIVSLAAENMGELKQFFIFFAVATLLAIFSFFGVVKYKDYLAWWKDFNARFTPLQPPPQQRVAEDFEGSKMSCPLCGSHECSPVEGLSPPDLTNFTVLQQGDETKKTFVLEDIAKNDELTRFKRVIISQCAKIINILAGE